MIRRLLLAIVTLLLAPSMKAHGQTVTTVLAPAPYLVDYQICSALHEIPLSDKNMLVLTVGTHLGQVAAVPLAGPQSFESVCSTYSMTTGDFGNVRAVAPSQMTVFNNSPDTRGDTYAGLDDTQALTLLIASLSDSQFDALLSDTGLVVSSLTSPWQQKLLAELLPANGKLVIEPEYIPDSDANADNTVDETSQLPSCSLRLAATVAYDIPMKGQPDPEDGLQDQTAPATASTPLTYQVDTDDDVAEQSTSHGQLMNESETNSTKPSNLDYGAKKLQKAITIGAVKTVDDLVGEIAEDTGVEVYADPRIGLLKVTIVGSKTATAGSLLEAIALCVTGTYRAVGSAYVLTDDLFGAGTRRLIWDDFDDDIRNALAKPLADAASYNHEHHPLTSLSAFDDPTWLSADELKTAGSDTAGLYSNPTGEPVKVAFKSLTQAQQDAIDSIVAQQNQYGDSQDDTSGKIGLDPGLNLQLMVPGIARSVDTQISDGFIDSTTLFGTSDNSSNSIPSIAPSETEAALLWKLVKKSSSIAVIVHPRTVAGVDADVRAMKQLGIKNMWLDILSGGVDHDDAEHQILREALAQGTEKQIRVFPVLSFLYRPDGQPLSSADINVEGQTSTEAAIRWQDIMSTPTAALSTTTFNQNLNGEGSVVPDFPGEIVSLCNPSVQRKIVASAVRASSPLSVEGIVLQDTVAPGYIPLDSDVTDDGDFDMGYTLNNRLEFLREYHADPLDLFPRFDMHPNSSGAVPLTLNYDFEHRNTNLIDKWRKFLNNKNTAFLTNVYLDCQGSVTSRQHPLPFIVEQRGFQGINQMFGASNTPENIRGSYVAWNGTAQNLPVLSSNFGFGTAQPGYSRFTYSVVQAFQSWLPQGTAIPSDVIEQFISPIVIDFADDPQGDDGNGNDPLTRFAALVSKGAHR
jgi:hypothetical protein